MSDLNTLGFDPISLPVLPAMKPLAEPSYGSTLLPPLPKPTTPVQAPLLAPAPTMPTPIPSMKPLPPTPPSVKQLPPVEPAKPPVSSSYAWLPEFARSLLKPTRQKGVIATGLVSLAIGAGVLRMVWPPPVPNRAVAEVQVAEPEKTEAPLPPVPVTPLVVTSLIPNVPAIALAGFDTVLPVPVVTSTPAFELPKMTLETPQPVVPEKAPQQATYDPNGPIARWFPVPMTKDVQQKWSAWIPEMRIPDPDRPTRAPTITLVSASEPVITAPAPPVISTTPLPTVAPTLDVPKIVDVPMIVLTGITPPAPLAPLTLPALPTLTPPVTVVAPAIAQPTLDVPAPKTPILEVKKPEAKFDVPVPKIDAVPQVLPKIEVTPALPKFDVNPVRPEPAKLEPFAVKPVAPSVPAVGETRTDYDVDLHYPKGGGETWASVSKQYLGDDRYGEALKAYNRNAALSQVPRVEIPPIHVLRKKYATLIGQPVANATEKSNIEWAAAPATRPTAGGYRQYAIPTGGMTMKEVAKAAYGDENMWGKIWDLNPTQRPDEAMRPGTKILLPTDAKIGE